MSRPKIKIEDLFDLTSAEIFNPDSYNATSYVSTDTRSIMKDSIFVALKGEKFDGHDFVDQAIAKGATTVIINRSELGRFDHLEIPIVTVDDTAKAYGSLSAIYRARLKARVIAITGSNGKTTTKEILSSLLESKYKVEKTQSNNNNHLGVPLTIFSADSSTQALVLELGTNHFGEIAYTAGIAQADFAVVTNIGQSHLEFLNDLDGVAKEKMALFEKTAQRGGKLFINADDPLIVKYSDGYANHVSFGFTDGAVVQAKIKGTADGGGTLMSFIYKGAEFEAELPLSGTSNAKNFLAAVAIALEFGMSPDEIAGAAKGIRAVDKRLNIIDCGSYTVVNDTYNANPESMRSGFEFIRDISNGRRTLAVLGDMFELGDKAREAHIMLAEHIVNNGISEVYCIGEMMQYLGEELKNKKVNVRYFTSREEMSEFLRNLSKENSVILLKGSRGMKMEEFIAQLKSS